MILVVGFPRSGTNFLRRLLAHYLDGPDIPTWNGQGHHSRVAKIHWEYQLDDYLGDITPEVIHIVRDPRDTAISGYFYYLNCFGHKRRHNISNYSLMNFLQGPFSYGFDGKAGWPCGWAEHVERWIHKPRVVCTSYEKLMVDREEEFTWTLYLLGLTTKKTRIKYAIEKSFEIGTERVPYVHKSGWTEQPKTATPTVGEWKKHFGRRESEFMLRYCGGLMNTLGYLER